MKKLRSKIHNVLGKVFSEKNISGIVSELIDILGHAVEIYALIDKSPKAQAICKAVQFAKQINDKQETEQVKETK